MAILLLGAFAALHCGRGKSSHTAQDEDGGSDKAEQWIEVPLALVDVSDSHLDAHDHQLLAPSSDSRSDAIDVSLTSPSERVNGSRNQGQVLALSTELFLATPTSFQGAISDCLSGYQLPVNQSNRSVKVQDGDFNCLFKIASLKLNGEDFVFSGNESWSTGQKFVVKGSKDTPLQVTVIANLASPINGPQQITIALDAAEAGPAKTVTPKIRTNVEISSRDPVGLNVADLDVKVDSKDGAGLFSFTLQCNAKVTSSPTPPPPGGGPPPPPALKCLNTSLDNAQFGFAVDTFPDALTLSDCRNLATTNPPQGGRKGTPFAYRSNGSFPNGGLYTGPLKGPARLYDPASSKLIFAVAAMESRGGCSYIRVRVSNNVSTVDNP